MYIHPYTWHTCRLYVVVGSYDHCLCVVLACCLSACVPWGRWRGAITTPTARSSRNATTFNSIETDQFLSKMWQRHYYLHVHVDIDPQTTVDCGFSSTSTYLVDKRRQKKLWPSRSTSWPSSNTLRVWRCWTWASTSPMYCIRLPPSTPPSSCFPLSVASTILSWQLRGVLVVAMKQLAALLSSVSSHPNTDFQHRTTHCAPCRCRPSCVCSGPEDSTSTGKCTGFDCPFCSPWRLYSLSWDSSRASSTARRLSKRS